MKIISNAGKDVKHQELFHFASGKAKCYSQCGKQYDNFLLAKHRLIV